MRYWAWLLLVPMVIVSFFCVHDLLSGVYPPYLSSFSPHPRYPELGIPWPMHPVDNPGDWLPNGLDVADVDGDGFPDFLVNYEWTGRIRVVFHPGPALSPRQFWPAVDVGFFPNAENTAFGDLDMDGIVDVVVVQGVEHRKEPSGVRILVGKTSPDSGKSRSVWEDLGLLPESIGLGHYLYVKVADLDGDGFRDIVAGGRAGRPAGEERSESARKDLTWTGLRWFQNPLSWGGDPRDPESWSMHTIDPEIPSGHGFVLADVNADGFLDLVVNNADWDTLDEEKAVLLYLNPGPERVASPWPARTLYRSPAFYGKEQVAVGDLDGNGLPDVVAQSAEVVHIFWNRGDNSFEHGVVEKHPALRWRSRPIALADLNRDGRLDIVGAAIHRDGALPKDVAAVWWLEKVEGGWIPHVIKWGSGFLGLGSFNGEKWDQLSILDVNDDGWPDIVANVEEFNRLSTILAVVWFENPGR